LFHHVVTIEDVDHGKPAPDLYVQAVKAVGRAAGSCLAYEDSEERAPGHHRCRHRGDRRLAGMNAERTVSRRDESGIAA
jgi:hypothetical protein